MTNLFKKLASALYGHAQTARSRDTYRPARRNEYRRERVLPTWRHDGWAHQANMRARMKERAEVAREERFILANANRHGMTPRAAWLAWVKNEILLRPMRLTNSYRKRIVRELGLA